MRILERYPEIARDNIHTAVVCGDLEEVERLLAERPQAASEKSSETAPDVIATEPELARVMSKQYGTPLLWLPDDETRAMEMVELLLANGTDPSIRNSDGQTAADRAERRGMFEVAEMLARS